ncbi:MAG TPA: preprotein translocase subunit YajC [Geminicoccaceae bacterium]|nr:preprotein translocase subunit YajC [Geminicoccaceae bacterium]
MLISPAYAQAAGAPGAFDLVSLMPLVLIFVVFYFLLIRPQQRKLKQHRELIDNLKKGDQVVTSGGILGRIIRIDPAENLAVVEIAQGVQVKVARHTIADLVSKPAPAGGAASTNDNRPGSAAAAGGSGFLSRLFKK